MRGGEQASEEVALLRMAAETAKVAGWALDLPSQQLVWSNQLSKILDRPTGGSPSLEEALEVAPAEHRDRLAELLQRCAADGTPYVYELPLTTAAGRGIWLRIMGEAVRDGSGAIIRVQGAVMDITEQKTLEREREQLEGRLAHTLETITDAFYTFDSEWRFTYLNQRAEQLLQRRRHELLGEHAWKAFPDVIGGSFATAYQRAVEEQTPVVVSDFYEPLGIWVEAQAFPSDDGLAVYFRDISDQVRAREVLLERQALLDKAQEAIWALDLDQRVTYWNTGAEQLWGWQAPDVAGRTLRDLLLRDPHDFDVALASVLRTGAWSGELTQVDAAGNERLIHSRLSLVRQDDGTPRSILGISTDITDQRHAEQQALRAQRLEAIGTLAGGIAHDLNNVLTPILMSVELLAMDESDPRRLEMLEMVRTNTKRGAQMVRQVLTFAGRIDGQRVPTPVAELLQDVRHIIRDTFPKNVHFTTGHVQPDLLVLGDPTQLHQVLLNLALNARDAMPGGGSIAVDAVPWLIDEEHAAQIPDLGPGRYVALRVRDDGHGMTPDVVARIFDPFFTTKRAGEGTGLGLPTSMAIITSHQGTLQVRSEPGVGTTFEILLPAVGEGVVPADADVDDLPRGAGETVLVIDDEEQVRTSTRRSLERFGYHVLTAADGADAITMVAEGPDVDVVLTDMMMPVLDGPATIRVIRAMRPDLPIIAASGLDASDAVGRAIEAGVTQFLAKPYTASALLTALQQVLAAGRQDES